MRAPEFWTGRSAGAHALSVILSPLGALYGLATFASEKSARPARAKARVVCVGNLTAGGTGKTPIALALARLLAERGASVVFLTRGYRGRLAGPVRVDPAQNSVLDVGDEALLLAAVAPTIVARDRAAGAVLADGIHADVIMMDDGLQNFSLAKDLSIVVVDAETGFGNGRLLPAGPLREPVHRGLARADAVVIVGSGEPPPLQHFTGPVLRARLAPRAPGALRGQAVLAFAGLGRPEKFFTTLREIGAVVRQAEAFPDHHVFTAPDLSRLKDRAKRDGLLLVTTEKDLVRIAADQRDGIVVVPVEAEFENRAALAALLDAVAARRNEASDA